MILRKANPTRLSMALILLKPNCFGTTLTGWKYRQKFKKKSGYFWWEEFQRNIGQPFLPLARVKHVSSPFVERENRKWMHMKAEEFDDKFDRGEDIAEHLDFSKARRPGRKQKRVNVDFPVWMIQSLDREAERLGVPRQSVIKMWIAERLDRKVQKNPGGRT